MIAVGLVLGSCTVTESSRRGGLVPPTGPAPTAVTTPVTVVTVAVDGDSTSVVTIPSTDGNPTSSQETSYAEPAPTTAVDNGLFEARAVLAKAVPLEDFREGVLGVSGRAGTRVWPVIIADTPSARQRGLMGVADFAALGGYAAMVFVFNGDTDGAVWMRDTPLPLRITFVATDGSVVSSTDMVPCLAPTPADECERYFPAGPYRFAVEHPLGPAFDLGLADADLIEVTIE